MSSGGFFRGDLRITGVARHRQDETYKLFPGKTSSARNRYLEAVISLEEANQPRRRLDLIFRAYDDGIAFRYRFPAQSVLPDLTIAAEHSTFSVVGNPLAYTLPLPSFTTPYVVYYQPIPVDTVASDPLLGLPLLLEYPDQVWAAITEADLNDYAGMYLSGSEKGPGVLTSRLSPRPENPQIKVKAKLPHVSPWRVIMIADRPGRLIKSNLITNLNPPCAITDTSWIKPGKTTFPWWNGYAPGKAEFPVGQNTQTHKYYIDFCAEAVIAYHSLDGLDNVAWYGGSIRPYRGADITKSLPEIDLPELISYAKKKGVGLRFWMNSAAAQAQMKKAFPIYEQWGIEGVMVDFFERDDQDMIDFVHEMVELAAKHHLTVARRHGAQWYSGSMTNDSARELSIPLHFAGSGPFTAEIYSDDPSAPEHPEKLRIERIETSGSQTIRAMLAPAGGHVIRLTPLSRLVARRHENTSGCMCR